LFSVPLTRALSDRFHMEPADLRRHRWPLFVALGICLILCSCATAPRVKVTAEVVDPAQARNRSVMVVADSFMSDAAEADMVAELVRGELVTLGFQVNDSEEKAELIVIPTLERSAPAGTVPTPTRMQRPIDISHDVGRTSLMGTQTAMRSIGFQVETPSAQELPRIGLMVTAVSKEVWLNAPLVSENEIPRVWRVVAVASLNKEDMTTKLVQAAGAKLGEITATPPTPTQPGPTQPAPSEAAPTQPSQTQPGPTQTGPTQPALTQPSPTPSPTPKRKR
jgi:hypothetical protein